ncbi:MAG TPA: glycine zipper domain-containing protein [Rhizomicrobium sp.]|nr:glycine zipper domain-containing protein [Rhizomicrobium sp.]
MLKKLIGAAAVAVLTIGTSVAANADACSGRDHVGGTIAGGVVGGVLGGAVTHSAGGAIGGAVLGGLAGNQIARSNDCNHRYSRHYRSHRYARTYYYDRYGHKHYYRTAAYR